MRDARSLDQALTSPANRGLVRHFLDKVPENERAALIDGSEDLNLQGLQRLRAALFSRVYGGEAGQRLTQTFFESIDPLVKNVEAGAGAGPCQAGQGTSRGAGFGRF